MSGSARDSGEQILGAAAELLAERGYKATTTRAIAERAGVNEVTLFRRFGSKQGILAALGEQLAANMAGLAVDSYPDAEDTRGTLERLARLEVEQALLSGPVAMRLAFDARSTPEVAALMADGMNDNLTGLVEYLASRQAAGDLRGDIDPSVMAEAFFALTSSLVMSRQLLGDGRAPGGLPTDEATNQLIELYWEGVRARETE
jgi:AcrR family transcriptional regulator